MSSCLGDAMRRTRSATGADAGVCHGMGNADGPSAGHALDQIVRNEIETRGGRERPRRGRGADRARGLARGSFTPRLPVMWCEWPGWAAAQSATAWCAGVDTTRFEACYRNAEHAGEVAADLKEAQKFYILGTPTFFVNGRRLEGALPAETFAMVIDSILATP